MKNILLLILLVVVIFGGRQYAFPAWESIQAARSQLKEVNNVIDQAEEVKEQRDNIISRLRSVPQADKERLDDLLPSSLLEEDIYVFLKTIVEDSGLSLEESLVSARPPSSAGGGSILFEIVAEGTYNNIKRMFSALESSSRLIDVSGIEAVQLDSGAFSMTIRGVMYHGN